MTYQQHAVVECEYNLDIPADVAAKGDKAIRQYCEDHETEASETTNDIVDWRERIDHTLEIEKL